MNVKGQKVRCLTMRRIRSLIYAWKTSGHRREED
jgi:hypothetical protein